jgi:hypothetical protein
MRWRVMVLIVAGCRDDDPAPADLALPVHDLAVRGGHRRASALCLLANPNTPPFSEVTADSHGCEALTAPLPASAGNGVLAPTVRSIAVD